MLKKKKKKKFTFDLNLCMSGTAGLAAVLRMYAHASQRGSKVRQSQKHPVYDARASDLPGSRELYGLQKRVRAAVLQPPLAEKYGIAIWAVAQSQKRSSKGPHPKNCTSLNETNSEAKYHGVGPTQAPLEVDGTRVASPRLSPEDVDRACSGSFHRLMAASVSTHGPISI